MIRWGVIGAGGIAHRRTMSAMNEAENTKLQALMVRDMERAKRLAQEHGAESYYDSVEGVLSDPNVDAVYIATPVYLHCHHVILAAESGKHVLCEKPMAINIDECKRMMDACNENGVHLEVCFLLRFDPYFIKIKQLVENYEMGQIIQARASFLKSYSIQDGLWRRDPNMSGGGVLMDMGAHAVDLLSYILGDVSKVTAMVNSRTTGWEVEDTATILMEMENGAFAIADTSYVIPHSDTMLEIYGTKGTALLTGGSEWTLKLYLGDKIQEESKPYKNLYKPLLEHFSKCLEDKKESITSGNAGLKNIQIISAAYESAVNGKTMIIDRV